MSLQEQIEDKKFEKSGYFNYPQLLSLEGINKLLEYQQLEQQKKQSGFYSSIWEEDVAKRQRDFEVIKNIAWAEISHKLPGYKLIMANFMIKKNEQESALGLHQDWTFTDEEQHRTTNIWIPLMDMTKENGPMNFILGSHRIHHPIRGKNIEQMFEKGSPFLQKYFNRHFLTKKGDAIVFDVRMIHYSPANISNNIRMAISMVIAPIGTQLVHYYRTDRFSPIVQKIHIDYTYFYEYHLTDIPLQIKTISSNKYQKVTFWKQLKAIINIIWANL
ncbi:MAG: phytanoyl-CoA dioxygenase family protein [Chitinophagales bacterium]|nr:phytanoyl-CoA dioxygenase family protein [Chitinophagales bacterium]